MRLCLFYCNYKSHFAWLENLISYIEKQGFTCLRFSGKPTEILLEYVFPYLSHVFIWNGEEDNPQQIISMCKKNEIPYSITEVGYFPQKEYFILDRKGINANSEVIDQNLDKVSDKLLMKLAVFAKQYTEKFTFSGRDKYVFVPLQLDYDTNIKCHSPYKSMQEFIDHVEDKFHDKRIVIKNHPLDKTKYKVRNAEIVSEGHVLEWAQDAELVYGINSTTLLETAMMGVPTIGLGNGFIKSHQKNIKNLLAHLVDKQVPVDSDDYEYWLKEYSDFYTYEKKITKFKEIIVRILFSKRMKKILKSINKRI